MAALRRAACRSTRVGIFIGSRMFGLASEATYRGIAYASILFVAVVSLPVFG